MTFLSVLIAFLVERLFPQYRPERNHRWLDGYCRRLASGEFTRWLISRPWAIAAVLLPPLLLIAWLEELLAGLAAPLQLAFGVVVLLYSLGPADLNEEAEAFIAARDAGDDDQAGTLARALSLTDADHGEPRRSFAVAHAVVVLAAPRLLAPLFWFVILGPAGAAGYRALALLSGHQAPGDCPQEMRNRAQILCQIADWAPARLMATAYAIAGNFDAVTHAWRSNAWQPEDGRFSEAERLLGNTGLAALDTFPDDADALNDFADGVFDAESIPPVVEDALALVWRSLAFWIAVIAAGSLVVALA